MRDVPKELIVQAAGGDRPAFEKIYLLTSGFVYSTVFRVTGNTEDAHDVTQNVFIKLYGNLGSFRFRSSFKTWLYRVSINEALNASARRAREMSKRGDFDIAIQTAIDPGTADERAGRGSVEKQLHALLGRLDPDQRACIVLREIEGLHYKEIADALDVNINTVRSRLKRAREALAALGKKEVIHHEV